MEKTMISVVVPTFNRPALVLRCLQHLIRQDIPASLFEIIIVHDGPGLASREAVECFLSSSASIYSPVQYYEQPFRAGPAAARNFGCRMAKGHLIAFTDDDCLPQPGWLKAFLEAAEKNITEEIAFTGRLQVPVSSLPTDHEKNTQRLETSTFIMANCCCTKKAFGKVRGFDERFTTAWREDSDLEFSFRKLHIPIVRVPGAIVVHPVRKASWGVSLREQKKSAFNALLYKKHPRLYRAHIQSHPPWNYYLTVSWLAFATVCLFAHAYFLSFALYAAVVWMTLRFFLRRVKGASHSFSHLAEMALTSFCIPALSVFWRLYGALKFKTWFL